MRKFSAERKGISKIAKCNYDELATEIACTRDHQYKVRGLNNTRTRLMVL